MSKIKGIFAAGMSVLNDDLSLNVEKTISHSERLINRAVMELQYLVVQGKHN